MANYMASMGGLNLPTIDANKIGSDIGSNVASLVQGGVNVYNEATGNTPAVKIDKFVQAYNNPNDTTIFSGLNGSLRTEKLARLLLPLDRELSGKYMQKAQEEKKREQGLAQNKTVVDAMKGVATEEEDTEGMSAIQAEIKLIEDELKLRKQKEQELSDAVNAVFNLPNIGMTPNVGMPISKQFPLQPTMIEGMSQIKPMVTPSNYSNRYQLPSDVDYDRSEYSMSPAGYLRRKI